jgi:hypothetical protein
MRSAISLFSSVFLSSFFLSSLAIAQPGDVLRCRSTAVIDDGYTMVIRQTPDGPVLDLQMISLAGTTAVPMENLEMQVRKASPDCRLDFVATSSNSRWRNFKSSVKVMVIGNQLDISGETTDPVYPKIRCFAIRGAERFLRRCLLPPGRVVGAPPEDTHN